jgi:hypothetical protein
MREVIFKHLTSIESRKKNILLQEVFEKDGITARTERRCFYFIKEIRRLDGEKDLQAWLTAQESGGSLNKRHFYIMKEHSDAFSSDKVICKVAGTFYVIVNSVVYTIGFLQSFKIRFAKETTGK